jgi:hypothetical protein
VCADEYRTFTAPDGKTVNAQIIAVRNGQVELKRENGRLVKVSPTVFIEEDQQYIREWSDLQGFMSDAMLRTDCAEKILETWKDEVWKDVPYENGVTENELMKEIKYKRIAYNITLENRGSEPLENVRMEYVIYYEQSQEGWETPVVKQMTFSGKSSIDPVPVRKKTEITTESVVVYQDYIDQKNWVSGRIRTGGEGQVHGIRIRLFMTTDEGKEFMREMAFPDSLSEVDFPWKG